LKLLLLFVREPKLGDRVGITLAAFLDDLQDFIAGLHDIRTISNHRSR